ncbi:MAG TPA: SAF domain-containing protein [Thermoclostridium sp.]|nr:hypothetical protein [Clostridiaceae bacterium]HOQ76447.1 SAF domain-containing protein [Thermoclostridium sp.]HPU44907.1 SAF domain-containing protein [Thermoclostridium sp.]
MFIRPRRFRIILAFMLGLGISATVLIGGYFYYRSNLALLESEMKAKAMEEARQAFNEEYPMSLVYVFRQDKKAGEIIADTDLEPAEANTRIIPADAVMSVEEAVGMVMRCDITKNTVVTKAMFYSEEVFPDDLRLMEYSVISLPGNLEAGSFIDVRIMFPNGLDYIILSKKKVIDLRREENRRDDLIRLHMTEEEILRMSSAIVDASLVDGSILYAVQYVAPDIQKEAARTYPANLEVLELIKTNPNIVSKAIETLEVRNRLDFEKRMDQDLILSGRRGVFGETDMNELMLFDISAGENSGEEDVSCEDDLNSNL